MAQFSFFGGSFCWCIKTQLKTTRYHCSVCTWDKMTHTGRQSENTEINLMKCKSLIVSYVLWLIWYAFCFVFVCGFFFLILFLFVNFVIFCFVFFWQSSFLCFNSQLPGSLLIIIPTEEWKTDLTWMED